MNFEIRAWALLNYIYSVFIISNFKQAKKVKIIYSNIKIILKYLKMVNKENYGDDKKSGIIRRLKTTAIALPILTLCVATRFFYFILTLGIYIYFTS
jgi:hypothetical protein